MIRLKETQYWPSAESFSQYRNEIYGIAALLIVFYHTFCVAHWAPFRVFSHGFIGVDLFLLIGGFCLCYSIQKNSLGRFYLNRFKRIYPLWFFVWFICVYPIRIFVAGEHITFLDALWEGTVILPLITGCGDCDWFTAAILLYYLVFPLLWKVLTKNRYIYIYIYISTLAIILAILLLLDFTWEQECAISRLPCFMLGIILYKTDFDKKALLAILSVSFIFSIIAYTQQFRYLWAATISPWLVIFMISFFVFVNEKGWLKAFKPLNWLGRNSLECYYGEKGNGYLLQNVYSHPVMGSFAFLLYMTVGTLFLSFVNRLIKKII